MLENTTITKSLFVLNETLRNLYASYDCDFIVYKKSQGIIDFYFVLADVSPFRVIPYVTSLITNPKKSEIHLSLLWKFRKTKIYDIC